MKATFIPIWSICLAIGLFPSCKKDTGNSDCGTTSTGEDSVTYTGLTQMKSNGISYQAGASAGSKIVFVGGSVSVGGNSFSLAQIYDIPSGQWTVDTVHLHDQKISNGAVCGHLLLFAGGTQTIAGDEILDIYNTKTGKWMTSSLPDAREGMAMVGLGKKVLFEGGFYANTVFSTADLFTRTQ